MGVQIRQLIPLFGVLTATAMSVTANGIVAIAVPWLVLERTGSAALASLAGAATMAPIAVSAVFGGALIDRICKRRSRRSARSWPLTPAAASPVRWEMAPSPTTSRPGRRWSER